MFAQLLSFGVKGGVPLLDPLSTSQGGLAGASHGVRRYVIGPTGELHLPAGFSVEVDALYRRIGFDSFGTTVTIPSGPGAIPVYTGLEFRTTGSDWQFPFLAKYEFRRGVIVHPFVDGGVTFRHVSLSRGTVSNPNTAGATVGGGLAFKFLFLRLSPEIRYTHFPTNVFGTQLVYVKSNSDQADFLVGFTF